MQRRILNRTLGIALGCAAVVAMACSDDSGAVNPVPQTSKQNGTGGGDTSHSPTSPTVAGPVASVRITPAQATIPKGYSVAFQAIALDANGVRVATKPATWRSGDVNIAVISDTGVNVLGKGLGTTKVYATIDGRTDSAVVTVVSAPAPIPTPAPAPALASFDLSATILGMLAGTDTSKSEPIAGAVVRLTRVGSVTGDTLNPSIDAGSAVTDASGAVSLKGLTGGSYSVIVTPPAGSPYAVTMTGFAPPRSSPYQLQLKLARKSP